MIRIIGDIHGKTMEYGKLLHNVESSIQIGDFGFGFSRIPSFPTKHRFIRGNHDSPEMCRKSPNWIPDGTLEDGKLFIGGGFSIDQHLRVEGISWWRDEELSIRELDVIIDLAFRMKPSILITHEAPPEAINQMFSVNHIPSRTSQALSVIFSEVKPKLWIFGHWHENRYTRIGETSFICLGELNHVDLID